MSEDSYQGEFGSPATSRANSSPDPDVSTQSEGAQVGADPGEAGTAPEFATSFDEPKAKTAGVGLLAVVVGGAAGYWAGGWRGGAAGVLLTGAARNGYRSGQLWGKDQEEAAKSASVALFGAVAGGWMAYSAYEEEKD